MKFAVPVPSTAPTPRPRAGRGLRSLRNRSTLHRNSAHRNNEQGYILLTILLVFTLMAIVAMTAAVPVKFSTQRDQEQEMIHRGVQYTRAIRGYYKKFGRYPTKLEDLDNTQNLRYLRKHYKDPLSCKNGKCQDFKLLHYGDPGLSMTGSGLGSSPIQGATPAGQMNGPNGAQGSAFGSSSSGFGNNSTLGGNSSFGNSSFGNNSSFGGNSSFGNSGFGGNNGVNTNGAFAQSLGNNNSDNSGNNAANGQPGSNPSDPSQASGQNQSGSSASGTNSNGQTFGGGPIVGVASLSKDKTIRIYNKKTKYNEWQFVYDPTADRGGLITTPYQPGLQNFGNNNLNGQNGQPGQPGTGTSPFGQSSFGSSNNGSSFGQSSFGQSNQSSFGQNSSGQNSSFGNNSNQNNQPQQPSSNSPQ